MKKRIIFLLFISFFSLKAFSAAISISWAASINSFTYDGSSNNYPSPSISGLLPGAYVVDYYISGRNGNVFNSTLIVNSIPLSAGDYQLYVIVTQGANSTTSSVFNYTINKATPTISVTGTSNFVFDGNQHGPVTSSFPSDATGTVTFSYTGTTNSSASYGPSQILPIDAGNYQVVATIASDLNYNSNTSSSFVFTIDKAASTVGMVAGGPYTYNGSAQGPGVGELTKTGSTGAITYNYTGASYSSITKPTNAGNYQVTATVATDANYLAQTSTAVSFTIDKAASTVGMVAGGPYTYNGSAQGPGVGELTKTGSTGAITYNYTGASYSSITKPTNAGNYQVTATVATDANYLAQTSTAVSFTIDKAASTVGMVAGGPYTYNGSAQGPGVGELTKTGSTGAITYNYTGASYSSITKPTNAGNYQVTATVATDANYLAQTSTAVSFTIDKAASTVGMVAGGPYTYNGSAQGPGVGELTKTGSTGAITYNYTGASYSSSTKPTNAGNYQVTATVATDANYLAQTSTAVSFTIDKAASTVGMVAGGPYTYNGSTQGPGVGELTKTGSTGAITYNYTGASYSSSTKPTNAGNYQVTATVATDANYLAQTSTPVSFTIDKATPTISVTNSPVVYNGSTQNATVAGSITGTPSSIKYNGSSTVPINAGTYSVTANFTPTDVTNYNSLTEASVGSFVINKATPTISITNSPVVYNGSAQSATVAGSITGTPSSIKYNGSSTVPINAGTYSVTADFTPTEVTNYNSLTGASAGSFVINKATPTISITNSPVVYNGSAQSATVAGSITGTPSSIKYNGSSTVPINAGTYPVTADFTPTEVTNYNSLTGASAGSLTITPLTININANDATKTELDPDPAFAFTHSPALYAPEVFTGSLSRIAGEAPADYPLTIGSLSAGGNYTLNLNSAKLTIKPLVTNYIFEVPNAFTPNLDGTNDLLTIIKNYRVTGLNYFRIYNRTGQLVFETNNVAQGWNGRRMGDMSGNVLESDLYVWIAEFTTMNDPGPVKKTGSVLLLK